VVDALKSNNRTGILQKLDALQATDAKPVEAKTSQARRKRQKQ
jgi:hypothetical protein